MALSGNRIQKPNGRDFNHISLNNKDEQVLIMSCAAGAKSVIYYCLVPGCQGVRTSIMFQQAKYW